MITLASHVFSQEEENRIVIDWKVIDSIVISPVLEFKDPIVERIFDMEDFFKELEHMPPLSLNS